MNSSDFKRPQWNRGQMLAFSGVDGPTDYASGLVARTVTDPDGIEVVDPGKLRLRFSGNLRDNIQFGGDFFRLETENGPIQGVMLDAHHLLVEGDCEVCPSDEAIRFLSGDGRVLVGSAAHFQPDLLDVDIEHHGTERRRWLEQRILPDGLSPTTRRTLTRAYSILKNQVYTPEGKIHHHWTTPDRWPHKDMWLWDSAFHAIGWRHVDPNLAMEMLEAMFDLQREDGFVTYRGNPAGAYFHLGDLVTQPPVLAHAVQLVFEKTRDRAWLERLYPKLEAYVQWDLDHRDIDGGGLAEWFIEDDESCRSGESGMDNSPRFDSARRLDAVDFNAFLARECEVLAGFAKQLGQPEKGQRWTNCHERLCGLINEKCWSSQDGFYFDYDPEQAERMSVWTSAGFLPLFCGAASPEQAAALGRHLMDRRKFASKVPVPSVAIEDETNYAKDMWRGPMWVNLNWLIAAGFERYGMKAEAGYIRNETLREIERTCEKFGTFFEFFDDRGEVEPPHLLRKGENAPEKNPYRQVIHDFGWTATLYVDWVHTGCAAGAESPMERLT